MVLCVGIWMMFRCHQCSCVNVECEMCKRVWTKIIAFPNCDSIAVVPVVAVVVVVVLLQLVNKSGCAHQSCCISIIQKVVTVYSCINKYSMFLSSELENFYLFTLCIFLTYLRGDENEFVFFASSLQDVRSKKLKKVFQDSDLAFHSHSHSHSHLNARLVVSNWTFN